MSSKVKRRPSRRKGPNKKARETVDQLKAAAELFQQPASPSLDLRAKVDDAKRLAAQGVFARAQFILETFPSLQIEHQIKIVAAAYAALLGHEGPRLARLALMRAIDAAARMDAANGTPGLVRRLFAVLRPELAARLGEQEIDAAIKAWRNNYGKWSAVQALLQSMGVEGAPAKDSLSKEFRSRGR